MSKVSGGPQTAGEALANLRDHYAKREQDANVQHRDELKEIEKTHAAELDGVRAEAETRVKTVQQEASEKLNQKDVQFQKEIEAMRAMYQGRQRAETKEARELREPREVSEPKELKA